MTDVVVVGAGIVGAACAYYLAKAGARVVVLDAASVAGGTSSAGEGNLLVSDKPPGPELALALRSRELWDGIGDEVGAGEIELEPKGGLVVWSTLAQRPESLLAGHRSAGVEVTELVGAALIDREPGLATGLAGGAYYPQDAQVQPVLATAALLSASGADVRCGVRVHGIEAGAAGTVTGLRLAGGGLVRAGAVVNAAGLAAGELAATAGTRLPIAPRRGFILVTEPLHGAREQPPIRHKVYAADYLDTVVSDDAGLQTSAVVESTRAGTVLIGSSRDRVGLDRSPGLWSGSQAAPYPLPVLSRIAAQAVALFPFLATVRLLRAYRGFRPFTPDHLPVIGPDPRVGGLWHAGGHEGAGIGLAPGTGALIAAQVAGTDPDIDPTPFAPARFG